MGLAIHDKQVKSRLHGKTGTGKVNQTLREALSLGHQRHTISFSDEVNTAFFPRDPGGGEAQNDRTFRHLLQDPRGELAVSGGARRPHLGVAAVEADTEGLQKRSC
jgi:hypothetical protein